MITELHMKKWAKHDGCTFKFVEGMNKIIGENEAGKSLIFEAIDFCFHGSEALRLPVGMYGNGLFAAINFEVRGKKYKIDRSLKTAQLFDVEKDSLLAKGSTAVTAEVRKIFGYTRNVFMTSNYSSQDSIQHLSKMLPAERKRTIDNVIGLSAVEKVLKNHKAELTILRRERDGVKNRQVDAPVPMVIPFDPQTEEKIKQILVEIAEMNAIVTTQRTNREQHRAIDSAKPVEVELLTEAGLITAYSDDEITKREMDIARVTGRLQGAVETRDRHYAVPVTLMAEPSQEGLLDGVTIPMIDQKALERHALISAKLKAERAVDTLPDLSGCVEYPAEKISDAQTQEKLYTEWLHVQDLKKKGSVTCTHCSGEVLLAADQIAEKYSHVPELVEKPVLSSQEMFATNKQLRDLLEKEAQANKALADLEAEIVEFDKNWYTKEQTDAHINAELDWKKYNEVKAQVAAFNAKGEEYSEQVAELEAQLVELNTDWFTAETLNMHWEARRNKTQNDLYRSRVASWKESKAALQPFDEEAMRVAEQMAESKTLKRMDMELHLADYKRWSEQDARYQSWLADFNDVEARMDEENLAVEALNNFKDKIKTTILPSVNRVASTWMHKMSEGKHTSVTLTDEMQILVNDYPIEALSISGRALGHLSLRMALGQVLTNSVFPVFMADEIDASMRDGRAQNVLDALTDMLKGSMKQVILISHRSLEHVEHTIEV